MTASSREVNPEARLRTRLDAGGDKGMGVGERREAHAVRREGEALKGRTPRTDLDETLRGGVGRRRRREEGDQTLHVPEFRRGSLDGAALAGSVGGAKDPMRGDHGRRPVVSMGERTL